MERAPSCLVFGLGQIAVTDVHGPLIPVREPAQWFFPLILLLLLLPLLLPPLLLLPRLAAAAGILDVLILVLLAVWEGRSAVGTSVVKTQASVVTSPVTYLVRLLRKAGGCGVARDFANGENEKLRGGASDGRWREKGGGRGG